MSEAQIYAKNAIWRGLLTQEPCGGKTQCNRGRRVALPARIGYYTGTRSSTPFIKTRQGSRYRVAGAGNLHLPAFEYPAAGIGAATLLSLARKGPF